MSRSTILHFVRHGEVDNPQGIYYGRLAGFHLSQKGKEQAYSAAVFLQSREVTKVYSSPLERTTETAKILTGHLGIGCEKLDWLNEVHSPFDGKPISLLAKRHWDVYTGSGPKFEQPGDVLSRAQRFIQHCRARHHGEDVVAVTHGDLIAFVTLWVRGIPITQQEKEPIYKNSLTHASISSLMFETEMESEIPQFAYWQP